MRETGTAHPACFAPTPSTIAIPGTLADQLRQRLLALSYPAFARCLCLLLEALGYEEVRPAGRQEWKGFNRPGGGGYDLEAVLPGGLAPRYAIAQIKQFDGLNVHQRTVDELRGACLRYGAAEGVLVTTSAFSNVVVKHAAQDASGTPVAPVRLIDGKELLVLMIRHRLGIRERLHGGTGRLEIDEAFFTNLNVPAVHGAPNVQEDQKAAAKPSQSMQKPSGSKTPEMQLEWKLTICLSESSGSAEETAAEETAAEKLLKKGGR